jgi:hypothetical protein
MDENLTKVLSDLSGLVKKLAGPLADEFGQMFGDRAREYRLKNALKIFHRVQKMLLDAGIDPQPIAPRLFLPVLEAASIEDNETLQSRWAALLANASDPQKGSSVLASFVEVLRQLTSEQAIFLDSIRGRVTMNGKLKPHITQAGIKLGNFNDMLQLFGGGKSQQEIFTDEYFRERVVLTVDDLVRLGIVNRVLFDEETLRRIGSQAIQIRSQNDLQQLFRTDTGFYLTPFGFAFLQACTAPQSRQDTEATK